MRGLTSQPSKYGRHLCNQRGYRFAAEGILCCTQRGLEAGRSLVGEILFKGTPNDSQRSKILSSHNSTHGGHLLKSFSSVKGEKCATFLPRIYASNIFNKCLVSKKSSNDLIKKILKNQCCFVSRYWILNF